VSEKFFALCAQFGAENVGMMTGDATVNGRRR
jgi:superfamily II RNA helicase